eukprot:GGOE01036748.1.p1 GENE.GGOE01036748.1~~GGOE01036748.1.p1  ORF type:complete len:527 (-),score=147.00 GGOE01036748.1:272-1852(-)
MSSHQHRRFLSLLCFGVSVGGVLFHCCGVNAWLLKFQQADRPFQDAISDALWEPLDANVDFPPIAALGIALLLRQKLLLRWWATLLAFLGSFLFLSTVLPMNLFPTIAADLLWTLLLFNWHTALPVCLLLHCHSHLSTCGNPKQFLLEALPAQAALEVSLHSPVLAAIAPHLVIANHIFHGCLAPTTHLKYAVLCAMVVHQLLDWGAICRWCRCGAWVLGAGVPVAAAISLCLSQDARVHEAVLYVLFAFALRRVLPLPASWWLHLALTSMVLRAVGGIPGLFPHVESTALQVLALTLINQLSLEFMKVVARHSRWPTAHQDANKAYVEKRSQSMVYAFSEPKQCGKMWSYPAGTHRWGPVRRWLGFQCRSLSIPNGMEVALLLNNGVMRSFQSHDNVDMLPELPVTGMVVRDSKHLERSRSPPSWALTEADGSEDEALLTFQSPFITSEQFRIRGQLRTDREVSRLRRSPEYMRHRRRLLAQALQLDVPVVLFAVVQFWFAGDPPIRDTIALLCATHWLGQVVLQ